MCMLRGLAMVRLCKRCSFRVGADTMGRIASFYNVEFLWIQWILSASMYGAKDPIRFPNDSLKITPHLQTSLWSSGPSEPAHCLELDHSVSIASPHLLCQNAALLLSVGLIMCLCYNISESWDCSFCFSRRIFLDKAGMYKDFCHWDIDTETSVSHRPDSLCLCLSLHPLSSTLYEGGILLFSDWVHTICIFIGSNRIQLVNNIIISTSSGWTQAQLWLAAAPLNLGNRQCEHRRSQSYWAGKLQLLPENPQHRARGEESLSWELSIWHTVWPVNV